MESEKPSWLRKTFVRFNLWTRDRWLNVATIGAIVAPFHSIGISLLGLGGGAGLIDHFSARIADKDRQIEKERAAEMGVSTSPWGILKGSLRFFNSSPRTAYAAAA